MLQSRYEGLARLRRRVKASDLEVYTYISISISIYLYIYIDCLPGIVVGQRSERLSFLPFAISLSTRFSSLPAGLGQARTCRPRAPAPEKVRNTLSRICCLPLDYRFIVYRWESPSGGKYPTRCEARVLDYGGARYGGARSSRDSQRRKSAEIKNKGERENSKREAERRLGSGR